MNLRNTPNQYWGHGQPPPDCCMSIICSALDRAAFKRYVKDIADAGIYYSHDTEKRTVTLAFGTPAERIIHQQVLRKTALDNGALIEVA